MREYHINETLNRDIRPSETRKTIVGTLKLCTRRREEVLYNFGASKSHVWNTTDKPSETVLYTTEFSRNTLEADS